LFNGKYICNVILAKGDQLEAKASKKLSGATAFEVAMRYNNYEIADLLLQQGACIDGYEDDRPIPLGELINSHSRDAITGIKLLLEHPRDKPSFIVDREQGRTALHLASGPDYNYDWQYLNGIDDHEAIMDMILAHYNEPKHLNARDKCGFTALHHASYRGYDWAVKKLLEAGADPNLHSCIGIRPLDCAQHMWGLSLSMDVASPNFNVSSPASKIRREAARLQCFELLTAAGASDIADSIDDFGFGKYVMGCLGLINNAKEDHEIYEPWIGEFPLTSVTKWLVKLRNRRSQARITA
jgi:ankyrin repeat protein